MRGFLLFILLVLAHIPIVSHAAAIHDAAMEGDVAAITAALDAGAGIDESDGTATPLYLAVMLGHIDAAKLLIERGADVNAQTAWGPPLMAAVGKDKIDLLNLLLERNADPNSNRDSESALHVAVTLDCLDCVRALVEAGADVNAKTTGGKTPLHIAKSRGQAEIAAYLLSHGVVLPTPAPISMKLASADVEKGRTYFARVCVSCHTAEPQGGNKIGPNLWSVVGRDKASVADMRYSDTLLGWEGLWTYEDLNRYLFGPMLTTPGVKMETPGVPDETERVNLIAYLRTLSDKPIPLP
ncbi:MAG: c-type cytochrome [Mesorhizobium sp.]|uniref:ankyrin repeat domain-containing protein n=1 Tax=unclassified Mesorhizobium TaxID=325217 RepID=UPI000F75E376|nr:MULTISPECIES: ankyrin repeat domain-containing protein [unclassified Mesorhizobium]RVD72027.1 c-type cytochrome [Mesorhizobium sp. M4A.F.Ca.ET.029.04.2.1]AZO47716.1 c-type cytochrome [Mesorhizobium sp. M4B.F.Ca.ET.058.02.1.1]RUX47505.1 c-type cytochrome [Mesorhizobium sp. M4A.F.Ca.ET.050.02.1.1]RVC74995.1 c-type cytochrome [Mesorhizobium sp. M4A.F.Ca.ET.022.05.2.1]RVD44334.1 c-type cytochrome [Mesorhizobium sp. M4A.F.Ca.ET.020.02.1.1]